MYICLPAFINDDMKTGICIDINHGRKYCKTLVPKYLPLLRETFRNLQCFDIVVKIWSVRRSFSFLPDLDLKKLKQLNLGTSFFLKKPLSLSSTKLDLKSFNDLSFRFHRLLHLNQMTQNDVLLEVGDA